LKRAGYEQAARFYFDLGEKQYEAPLNRLCREELYATGAPADRLQSVQKRLQELTGTPTAFGQEDPAQAEKERLSLLKIRLLLQMGAYDNITQAPETLYLTGPLTAELVDAFPHFGKDLPPFLYKLAEARIAVFEKRYTGAWSSVQEAFGIEHTFAGLASPALLSDIGKAGVYGAENLADAAVFFEDFAAQVRSAAAKKYFSDGEERRYLFYALFYAARCRTKIGGAAQRVDIAEAEIPVQHIPHPCEIADEIRLVQPQLRPCLGDHLVADDGDLPHAQCHLGGIGGDETDEREADERNRNEQRNRQQNAPNDILFHSHTISIAHRTQEKDCRTCRDSPPHPKIITSSS